MREFETNEWVGNKSYTDVREIWTWSISVTFSVLWQNTCRKVPSGERHFSYFISAISFHRWELTVPPELRAYCPSRQGKEGSWSRLWLWQWDREVAGYLTVLVRGQTAQLESRLGCIPQGLRPMAHATHLLKFPQPPKTVPKLRANYPNYWPCVGYFILKQ